MTAQDSRSCHQPGFDRSQRQIAAQLLLTPVGQHRLAWSSARSSGTSATTSPSVARFAPFFTSPRRSLGRLFANYTVEQLEVSLDFLTRSTQGLRAETRHLANHPVVNRQRRP
jgi:hypothetical protein